jgi:hypothetical protein
LGVKSAAFSHPPGPPTRFPLLLSSLAALRLTIRVRLRHVWGASHPPMRGLVLRLRVRGYPEKLAGPSVPGTAFLLRPLAVRPGVRVRICLMSCCVCLVPRRFRATPSNPCLVRCRARGAPRDLPLATRSSMKGRRPTRPSRWSAPACPKRDPFSIPLARCPTRTPNAPPSRVTAPQCRRGKGHRVPCNAALPPAAQGSRRAPASNPAACVKDPALRPCLKTQSRRPGAPRT